MGVGIIDHAKNRRLISLYFERSFLADLGDL